MENILMDGELRKIFELYKLEKIESMSSEALLSTSACPGASLSTEEENMFGYTKSKGRENE